MSKPMPNQATKRLYGSKWQRARAAYLKKHPLCVDHEKRGLLVQGTVVDHIVPHKGDMKLFWDSSNWQTLCANCHNSFKKRLEMSGKVTGCDVNGVPLDSNHHWNQ
jgi:5-methylcytosine-specific restriction enzyme A